MKNEDRKNSENEREKAKYKATIPDTTFPVSVRFLGLANLDTPIRQSWPGCLTLSGAGQ